ncbi:MAG TPA: ABC transporter ATP-binding protein [Nitrososphaerales archaeon]|nr:ABC transporter ATP-binding protein [Nitrososphaerales archaeon]
MLSCENLIKIYPDRKRRALDGVSFSVPATGIFVLIGRNGSGKTTLVRILATELSVTSGSASIDGVDVMRNPDSLRERIAIVPQEARTVPWMTPLQTVSSYLMWRGFGYGEARRRATKALRELGIESYANSLNRTLSGGNRRKVLVATVMASEAEIIFLDEPTTGLDPISRREFWDLLRNVGREKFTFLTTHYLEEAEALADEIGILDQGKMVRIGSLDELRKSVPYSYALNIPFDNKLAPPVVQNGEVVTGAESYRILTTEEEAFSMSRELSKGGFKFSINPVSLDDIFFYVLNRLNGGASLDGSNDREGEDREQGRQRSQARGFQ